MFKHLKSNLTDNNYEDKNDNYKEEYIDEDANVIPEHIPYYSTTIFVPDDFTEEMMNELYEEKEEI